MSNENKIFKSFEEWKQDHENNSSWLNPTSAKLAWNARQPEIDELKKDLRDLKYKNKNLQDALDGETKEDPFSFTTYCQSIRYELENEIGELKKELADKDEALEFYANKENWMGYHRDVDTIRNDSTSDKAESDGFKIKVTIP